MDRKNELIAKLNEKNIGDGDLCKLAESILCLKPAQKRIPKNNRGLLGILNRYAQRKRQARYKKKISGQFSGVKIVSEGDSWFQFPVLINDIIDWLMKKPNYAVYSLGFAGDWLHAMLHQDQNEGIRAEYKTALENEQPAVFLIGGGGNDLLDDHRLEYMVNGSPDMTETDHSLRYFKDDYRSLIRILSLQYERLFAYVRDNHSNIHVICYGYDYPIPSNSLGWGLQFIVNLLTFNGKWLYRPMSNKGIHNQQTKELIARTFIDDFNKMLIDLSKQFARVHHVDCRETVARNEWYNELHPDSEGFRKIAQRFEELIESIP